MCRCSGLLFVQVIVLRVSRVFFGWQASLRIDATFLFQAHTNSWEARLSKATEALGLVPIVAILMRLGLQLQAFFGGGVIC